MLQPLKLDLTEEDYDVKEVTPPMIGPPRVPGAPLADDTKPSEKELERLQELMLADLDERVADGKINKRNLEGQRRSKWKKGSFAATPEVTMLWEQTRDAYLNQWAAKDHS